MHRAPLAALCSLSRWQSSCLAHTWPPPLASAVPSSGLRLALPEILPWLAVLPLREWLADLDPQLRLS